MSVHDVRIPARVLAVNVNHSPTVSVSSFGSSMAHMPTGPQSMTIEVEVVPGMGGIFPRGNEWIEKHRKGEANLVIGTGPLAPNPIPPQFTRLPGDLRKGETVHQSHTDEVVLLLQQSIAALDIADGKVDRIALENLFTDLGDGTLALYVGPGDKTIGTSTYKPVDFRKPVKRSDEPTAEDKALVGSW
jgi:hypothetical protein